MKNSLRIKIIEASYKAGACHIGSALSCADIIEAVYKVMVEEDIFLFSKASGVSALYCHLYPVKKATEYLKKYPLASKEVPGVVWSGGSLGMGLSVAVGLALGDRQKKVYCLISDGELQEGNIWEAILFAAHHKLNNLIVIVDRNRLQAMGNTEDILKLEPLEDKFKSFGWDTITCDGHNIIDLIRAIKSDKKPLVVIARTIKGKGINFMENNYHSHYLNLDETRFKKALLQLSSEASPKR